MRRLAYEAADTGLLSPELAAGIRRVKGSKKLGRQRDREGQPTDHQLSADPADVTASAEHHRYQGIVGCRVTPGRVVVVEAARLM